MKDKKSKETKVKSESAPSKKLLCTCSNEYQDSLYGKGFRVHNPTCKTSGVTGKPLFRCTGCTTERVG